MKRRRVFVLCTIAVGICNNNNRSTAFSTAAIKVHKSDLRPRSIVQHWLTTSRSSFDFDDNDDDDSNQQPDVLIRAMQSLGYTAQQQSTLWEELAGAGLVDETGTCSRVLITVTRDFLQQPHDISKLLMRDFGISALTAHQTRAALVHASTLPTATSVSYNNKTSDDDSVPLTLGRADSTLQVVSSNNTSHNNTSHNNNNINKPLLFKQVIVNPQAKQRRQASNNHKESYGLPRNYASRFVRLARELNDFEEFMTRPRIDSQGEDPIRPATANVYLRHARLFLGWYVEQQQQKLSTHKTTTQQQQEWEQQLSLYQIIPNKDKESADQIIQFLLWLRSSRQISVSYEANLLRGLTKLLKYRFRNETQAEEEKSFHDIPVIRELRKLHRNANKQQAMAPRSSEEDRKWLSWPEYLSVVQKQKEKVEQLLKQHVEEKPARQRATHDPYTAQERKIAVAFQKYLILAFFANVPDRQRTIRELEIGRTLVKKHQQWCIKHDPDDYKTGKTYGERPPLHLSVNLTSAIDEFLTTWRPCLLPANHNYLFVQSRTGQPLTQDSVYQIVARTCFEYTGQRTNPHLLRDMIVTHVRESQGASEQQLEALALFMGHSIQIQRASYDRRTLTQKVAPAIELIESVNSGLQSLQ